MLHTPDRAGAMVCCIVGMPWPSLSFLVVRMIGTCAGSSSSRLSLPQGQHALKALLLAPADTVQHSSAYAHSGCAHDKAKRYAHDKANDAYV